MNLFSPAEVARNYIGIGKGKAALPISKMILLGILTLFIGYLWIIPYMRQSITCFYTSLNDEEASQA